MSWCVQQTIISKKSRKNTKGKPPKTTQNNLKENPKIGKQTDPIQNNSCKLDLKRGREPKVDMNYIWTMRVMSRQIWKIRGRY